MTEQDNVIGGDPPVDGMQISLRLRRDFVISDAARFIATARDLFMRRNSWATAEDAAEHVTSAAEALFLILESDGILGPAVDRALAARTSDGLELGGWQAQVTPHEPKPLPSFPNCFDQGDVFALPTLADEH